MVSTFKKTMRRFKSTMPGYRQLRRRRALSNPNTPEFLKNISGVIHIGANAGQEAGLYAKLGLDVIWIEPIPEVFERLKENISSYRKQQAYRLLMTETDGEKCAFHVANNGGESSSILELGLHKEAWPHVDFVDTIELEGTSLSRLVDDEEIDLSKYQALILDTQGAELQVLRGAKEKVRSFRYIQAEAADYEAYVGCCKVDDLVAMLGEEGFDLRETRPFKMEVEVGNYYDLVFENTRA
jgi:FkbM family methyltransferase